MNKDEPELTVLKPMHETLKIIGELSYGESQRAWNLIRLKQDLLKEFPQLKQRREDFSYQMIMHRTYEDLKKAIKDMEKSEAPIPIFLFLCKKNS